MERQHPLQGRRFCPAGGCFCKMCVMFIFKMEILEIFRTFLFITVRITTLIKICLITFVRHCMCVRIVSILSFASALIVEQSPAKTYNLLLINQRKRAVVA